MTAKTKTAKSKIVTGDAALTEKLEYLLSHASVIQEIHWEVLDGFINGAYNRTREFVEMGAAGRMKWHLDKQVSLWQWGNWIHRFKAESARGVPVSARGAR